MIDTILPLPASLAIAAFTLAYTPPKSKLRWLAGLTIAGFNWIAAQSTIAKSFPGFIAPEYILGWVLLSNNWLNLAQLEYKSPAKGYEQPNARLQWAIDQVFSTRYGVSPSQIPFFDKKRPQWTPSKTYFLLWKIWTITWCGSVVYALAKFEPLESEDILHVPSHFLTRIPEMKQREIVIRVYYAFEVLITSYCNLCLMHAACGFIAVAIFRDDQAGWRPLHGSPLEALGMRGFYRTFWHHCMRKGFTSHAIFLVNDVLKFPRKKALARYLIVVMSFVISGLYHAALTPDIPWDCSMKQIPYQMRIVGAILFEDAMVIAWSKFAPQAWQLGDLRYERESTAVTDSKTTSTASNGTRTELRRRNGKVEFREYPKSPMHVTQSTGIAPETKNSINWVKIALYGVSYIWTICFLIWANSSLVWETNQCIIKSDLSREELDEYFQIQGLNKPF